MKKFVYGLILMLLVVLGRPGLYAAALDDSSPFLGLEGQSLSEAEMEDIVGGLPRCCHHPRYDAIEDGCLNNKGQKYDEGYNDCDIWIENVLMEKGINIASKWGSAKSTSVRNHRERVKNQLSTTQPEGWSIMIIDESHVAITRLNPNGSIDIFHQGRNRGSDNKEVWEARGYSYSNRNQMKWDGKIEYWAFQ